MAFYVYILQCLTDGSFYKGSTQDPLNRLLQHNEGRSKFTSTKGPWKMVYLEEMTDKKSMLIREKKLKRGNKDYFQKLIDGDKNIVSRFF